MIFVLIYLTAINEFPTASTQKNNNNDEGSLLTWLSHLENKKKECKKNLSRMSDSSWRHRLPCACIHSKDPSSNLEVFSSGA